jgi:UrcA family protein
MKLAIAFVATILSLTMVDARAAGPAEDAFSVTVQFDDLDLTREPGIARLYSRIKGAARQVCDQPAEAQLVAKQKYAMCVKRAVAEAVARINRPLVSDYFARRDGRLARIKPANVASR